MRIPEPGILANLRGKKLKLPPGTTLNDIRESRGVPRLEDGSHDDGAHALALGTNPCGEIPLGEHTQCVLGAPEEGEARPSEQDTPHAAGELRDFDPLW